MDAPGYTAIILLHQLRMISNKISEHYFQLQIYEINVHNHLYGSDHLNTKGKVIDSLLKVSDLVLLGGVKSTRIKTDGTFVLCNI